MLDTRLIPSGERLLMLQLFGDGSGAAPAGGGDAGAAPAPASGQQAGGTGSDPAPYTWDSERTRRRRARAAAANADYSQMMEQPQPTTTDNDKDKPAASEQPAQGGADASASDKPASEQPPAPRHIPLKELMDSDAAYKDEFQQIFNQRFKDHKGMAELIDTFHAIFGTSDMESLAKAVNDDQDFWQYIADTKGMTKDQYRQHVTQATENARLRRENAELRGMSDPRTASEGRAATLQSLRAEEQALRAISPDFDLNAELHDPKTGTEFGDLLRTFVRNGHPNPVERAYKIVHESEILSETVAQTMRTTEQRVADNIRARGQRPAENGASASPAAGAAAMFAGMSGRSKEAKAKRAELAARYR